MVEVSECVFSLYCFVLGVFLLKLTDQCLFEPFPYTPVAHGNLEYQSYFLIGNFI